MSGWHEVPLRHEGSGGSSAPGDHTVGLLGQGPHRTSSGMTDDSSPRLPSPHNRTPIVVEAQHRPHSEGHGARGQPAWHRQQLEAQAAAMAEAEAAFRRQAELQQQQQLEQQQQRQPPWMKGQDAHGAQAAAERQRMRRQQQAGGGGPAGLLARAQTQAADQMRHLQSSFRGWQQPRGDPGMAAHSNSRSEPHSDLVTQGSQGTYGAASAATPPVMVPQAQLQQHSMPQQTAWRYPEAHPGMAAAAAEILSSPGYPQHQQPHPSPRQLQLEHLSPRQQHTSPRQQLPSPRQPQPGLYQDQSAVVAGRGAVDFEIPLVDVPYIGSPPPGGVSANHRGTGEIRAEVAWQSGRRASLDSPAKGRRSSVDSPANSRHGSGDVAQLTRQISGVGGPLQGRRGSGGATGVPERHSSGEVLTQGGSGAFGSQIKRFGLEGGGGSGNLGSTPPWSANRSTFPTFRHISEEGDSGRSTRGPRRTGSGGADVEEGGIRATGTPKASSLPGLIGNALGLRIGDLAGDAYSSPASKSSQSFKWNQNPFVSLRDVWQSLPRVARVLLVWVAIEAVLIFIYALTILITNTFQQFVFPLLITGIFLFYLVWDAVLFENTTQLFASMLLAFAISLARIIANSVGRESRVFKGQALGWFIFIMHVVTIVLALLTWRDFGWRLHSRLGVDFRQRGARERRRLHSAQAVFVTLIKFDVMWEISLVAVAIALARAHSSNQPQAERLVAINIVGLFTNVVIGWGAWTIVRHRSLRTLWPIVDVLMPISFLQPILTFALVWSNGWEKWNASYWDSLVVSAPLVAASRLSVWICMHYMLWRIKQLEAVPGVGSDDDVLTDENGEMHPALVPLLRGAWLGKPSHVSPRKRCFFQLSQDGSTLRWSWHKFIRLYYIDEVICNDAKLQVCITMTVDRDLLLQFDDHETYGTWVRGLDRALEMLMGPGVGGPETPATGQLSGRGSGGMIRSDSGGFTALGAGPHRSARMRMLNTFGISFTNQTAATPSANGALGADASAYRSRHPSGLEGASRRPGTDHRWTFWNRSNDGGAAATAMGEAAGEAAGDARVDKMQKVRRLQMAHFLDQLHRATQPMSPSVAPPAFAPHLSAASMPAMAIPEGEGLASVGSDDFASRAARVAQLEAEAEAIAALEDSAARTRRPGSPRKEPRLPPLHPGSSPGLRLGSPPKPPSGMRPSFSVDRFSMSSAGGESERDSVAARAAAAATSAAVDASGGSDARMQRPMLETPSMVWARIQTGNAAAAQSADSPPLPEKPIASTASGIWANIMKGNAINQREEQENVAPIGGSATGGAPHPRGAFEGAQPLQESGSKEETPRNPIGRSVTEMWALLQSGKPVVDEDGQDLPPIATLAPGGQLATVAGGMTPSTGGGALTPSPAPSPGVDSALHSIWVDIVDQEDLHFGRRLGAGAQGEIYAAWLMPKGREKKPVAVKKFSRAADAVQEVQMHLCAGQHPNIVELRALCQRGDELWLIMELLPRGTLEVMLHRTVVKRWDIKKLLLIIRSIAGGVHYLHTRSPPILHRDLKPGNLFVGANQNIKIGDFGMSRFVGGQAAAEAAKMPVLRRGLTCNVIGTAHYASPELLNDELLEGLPDDSDGVRHLKVDVFAFGVTLWEMLTRQRPHHNLEGFEIQGRAISNPAELVLPPIKLPGGDEVTLAEREVLRALADLVLRCTEFNPDDRPTMAQILQALDKIWINFERGAVGSFTTTPSGRFSRPSSSGGAASGRHSRPPSRPVSGEQPRTGSPPPRAQSPSASGPPPHPGHPTGLASLAASLAAPLSAVVQRSSAGAGTVADKLLGRHHRGRSFSRASNPGLDAVTELTPRAASSSTPTSSARRF